MDATTAYGSSQAVTISGACQRAADAYLTAKRITLESSDVPWAVPMGVSTVFDPEEESRGQRALRTMGDSFQLQSSALHG